MSPRLFEEMTWSTRYLASAYKRMTPLNFWRFWALVGAVMLAPTLAVSAADNKSESGWVKLFPEDGTPKGWKVGAWNDVSKPAEGEPKWVVKDGILHGGEPRGSWLMSEKEYGDFILEYDFKLGERGNSGLAIRAPMKGDPAFDGLELQMADFRYNPSAKDSELTGGLYRALAPSKQVYKPTDWNTYRIELRGSRIIVTLNGEKIQDADLSAHGDPVKRHDGTMAVPLKDRPRRGHLGFQELSRGGDHALIRNARIKPLD